MKAVRKEKAARKPRADSVRNRERLLKAAARVLGAGGPEASLEAVARRAGVGIGTLYRHFPTRDALFEAVYRHEVEELAALAESLAKEVPPVDALRRWIRAIVQLVATKKGMLAALALVADGRSDLWAYSSQRLSGAVGTILARAAAAGQVRRDVRPEDLLHALIGLCYAYDRPDWQETVLRLADVFVDGLLVKGQATQGA
ncbi:TetR/AcrR family transcriptional regulator [Reyranella sp.]|uniref:TetR/AcrR family transcriptional regulator n=1 Tax=Reyranella sp. TaxID=1929291 RepID=UPI003BAA1A84